MDTVAKPRLGARALHQVLRNVELGAAFLTGLVGFLGSAYALFGPGRDSVVPTSPRAE